MTDPFLNEIFEIESVILITIENNIWKYSLLIALVITK